MSSLAGDDNQMSYYAAFSVGAVVLMLLVWKFGPSRAKLQASLAQKVQVGKKGPHLKGTALANVAIEQDAAYWEVKVLSLGVGVQVGVAYDLSEHLLEGQVGDRERSWATGTGPGGQSLEPGDVI